MTVERMYRAARLAAEVAILAGLTLAEFAKLYAFGMVLVLVGLAAAGGALVAWIIHEQEKKGGPEAARSEIAEGLHAVAGELRAGLRVRA